ncbi:MAG: SDR family oxidoreductase [Bacteroidetes bacterium]|nr:SDR family oxidoreductase [Bacteroidota bacterium]MCH8524760.1 SDR family oxidoreductase [Balneolales bacterium]
MEFSGKSVLITGASSGIGVGFAHAFARDGAQIILTARREDRLRKLAEKLKGTYNCKVDYITADLSRADGVQHLIAQIESKSLQVDILINNAGFGYIGEFASADNQTYRSMNDVNMTALTELCHAFMPEMRSRNFGGVLNVASMAAVQPMPYFAVYAATKAYVTSLSQALWKEYQHSSVHVTALCPGPVQTEFFEVSGYKPENAAISRSIQSVEDVVEIGIIALKKNTPFATTSVSLRLLSFLQRFTPRKLSLNILAAQMKSSVN